jgi:hypothetical protein
VGQAKEDEMKLLVAILGCLLLLAVAAFGACWIMDVNINAFAAGGHFVLNLAPLCGGFSFNEIINA